MTEQTAERAPSGAERITTVQETHLDPQEALALAARTRRRTADRGQAWWYHLVYGVAFAILTAGVATPWSGVCSLVAMALLAGNFIARRRSTGLGHIRHGPRARAVAIAAGVLLGAAWIAAVVAFDRFGIAWAPLAAAPVLGAAGAMASWLVDRTWRAEQLEG